MYSGNIHKLQADLNRLEERTVENEMKINPGKEKKLASQKPGRRNELGIILGIN